MSGNSDSKPEDQNTPLDPNKPDPNVKPPQFIIATEGWDPDPSIFKVRDADAAEEKK
jgi:hypothetical protein